MTPLQLSVCNTGALDVTKLLIAKGANVASETPDTKVTALHLACKEDNPGAVRVLVKANAPLLAVDFIGRTVLHAAALGSSASVVRKLNRLTKGALLNAVDLSGYTPLMLASEHGRLDVVSSLLQLRADAAVKNRLNHAAVELADWFGHRKVVDLLDQYTKLNGASTSTGTGTGTGTGTAAAASGGGGDAMDVSREPGSSGNSATGTASAPGATGAPAPATTATTAPHTLPS